MYRIIKKLLPILLLGLSVGAVAEDDSTDKQRIITAAGARVRVLPQPDAATVATLPLGSLVSELNRSQRLEHIGATADYWYEIRLPDGQSGWVFGALTTAFAEETVSETYLKITRERLSRTLLFPEQIELVNFLEAVQFGLTPPEAEAELGLAYVQALRAALAMVNALDFAQREQPPYSTWLAENGDKGVIGHNESSGEFFVQLQLFRELHNRYYPLPVSDTIAWEAAQNPAPGECEGFLACYLAVLEETYGYYLKHHPDGQHVAEAVAQYDELFGADYEPQIIPEDRPELERQFAVLTTMLERLDHPDRAALLERFERWRQGLELPKKPLS